MLEKGVLDDGWVGGEGMMTAATWGFKAGRKRGHTIGPHK